VGKPALEIQGSKGTHLLDIGHILLYFPLFAPGKNVDHGPTYTLLVRPLFANLQLFHACNRAESGSLNFLQAL
jgi:hypothetical protein